MSVDREQIEDDRKRTSATIIALVTEAMHRRQLDEADPILGGLDKATVLRRLDRLEVQADMIEEILDSPDQPHATMLSLVNFAALVLDSLAAVREVDPFDLLQQLAMVL